MRVLLLTNEYPPYVYGGAGVHVEHLSRELAKLCEVDLRCFGDQRQSEGPFSVTGFDLDHRTYTAPVPLQRVFGALQRCLDFNTANNNADIVHVHTWYTHLGGILAKLCYSIPLVVTAHSLEPLRPWKREQLAGGYDFTCWVEKTALKIADAVVAVSNETKNDIIKLFHLEEEKVHVIHNGIDPAEYYPIKEPERLKQLGIDARKPYVFFVGRMTKQKGVHHFLNAIKFMNPDLQVVVYSAAPDTAEIEAETRAQISELEKTRGGVIWIKDWVDLRTKVALFSHAAVFCCSSIYEPFGITNLEAMACETAVVASAVGGIKEVVAEGETGLLVSVEQSDASPFEALYPEKFARDLAEKVNYLMARPKLRAKMGKAGRLRAENVFSWAATARKTRDLYESLISRRTIDAKDLLPPSAAPLPKLSV